MKELLEITKQHNDHLNDRFQSSHNNRLEDMSRKRDFVQREFERNYSNYHADKAKKEKEEELAKIKREKEAAEEKERQQRKKNKRKKWKRALAGIASKVVASPVLGLATHSLSGMLGLNKTKAMAGSSLLPEEEAYDLTGEMKKGFKRSIYDATDQVKDYMRIFSKESSDSLMGMEKTRREYADELESSRKEEHDLKYAEDAAKEKLKILHERETTAHERSKELKEKEHERRLEINRIKEEKQDVKEAEKSERMQSRHEDKMKAMERANNQKTENARLTREAKAKITGSSLKELTKQTKLKAMAENIRAISDMESIGEKIVNDLRGPNGQDYLERWANDQSFLREGEREGILSGASNFFKRSAKAFRNETSKRGYQKFYENMNQLSSKGVDITLEMSEFLPKTNEGMASARKQVMPDRLASAKGYRENLNNWLESLRNNRKNMRKIMEHFEASDFIGDDNE